jgi:hypothetical protein
VAAHGAAQSGGLLANDAGARGTPLFVLRIRRRL